MVSVYVLVILLASSALMFYIERGTFDDSKLTWYRIGSDGKPEPSPFQSIVHTFWWSIVTLTTTGYGDAVPVTGPGKLVAAITMACGLLVIALPTSIIGSNFNTEWALHRRIQFQMRLHHTREQAKVPVGNKTARIIALQNQNKSMLEALADIQERLSEINPPRYYRKYKCLQTKHFEALEKITELENRLAKWKRIARNLESFNNNHRSSKDFDSENSDSDADIIGLGNKMSKWSWKNVKNVPFRSYSRFSLNRTQSDAEAHNKNKIRIKSSGRILTDPLRKLSIRIGRSATNLTTRKDRKSGKFTKEMISSPTELRPAFTPINNSERGNNSNPTSYNSRSIPIGTASESNKDSQHILTSKYINDTKGKDIDENNIGENEDLDENIQVYYPSEDDVLSTYKITQDNVGSANNSFQIFNI